MNETPVSVIIPAYNAERDIARAIRSVLDQTHKNIELIVIDDGSTDKTASAALAAFEQDTRARLLTVENAGPAAARNRGLDETSAQAEYVMFVDADDYLMPDAVEYALSAAEKGAELVMMGFTIENYDGSRGKDYFEPEEMLEASTQGGALPRLYAANMLNQVWAKLFSLPLLRANNIRFSDYRWGEDRLFIFDCLEHAARTAVLPECKYLYVMHKGESLISAFYKDKHKVCCLADKRMSELCGGQNDAQCRYMFAKSIFSCMTNMYTPSCKLDYAEKREYVREILQNEQVQGRTHDAFGGASVKIMCAVLHTRVVWLNMLAFRLVAFLGRTMPRTFMRLKHKK